MAERSTIAAWNLVSRVTGFVRVLAVAAALGVTYVGNTYQSANLVSNVVFELVAGGLLTVPLVPVFVQALRAGGDRSRAADGLSGTLVTAVLVVLGTLAVAGMATAPTIMRLLTSGVGDPIVRAAQVQDGTALLRWFLPQLVLYGVGAVATAQLHARGRFAAAAAAPVLNNLVVTATMVLFVLRHGSVGPGSDGLGAAAVVLLGAGTTAGVLAMTLLPVIALARTGASIRPRRPRLDAGVRSLGRAGAWGAVLLAANQGLVAVTLVLANRVRGGVVAYHVAFAFFLLPVALLAHPVFTSAHPRLAADADAGDWASFAARQTSALGSIVALVVPAGAVLALAGPPAVQALRVGALDAGGAALVGRTLAAYAAGLGGYATFLLLARSATAGGRADLAARAAIAVLVVGSVAMVLGTAVVDGTSQMVALGVAHSVAWTGGAIALAVAIGRALPAAPVRAGRPVVDGLVAAAGATIAGVAARSLVPGSSRAGAGAEAIVTGLAASTVALGWLHARGHLRMPRRPAVGVPG